MCRFPLLMMTQLIKGHLLQVCWHFYDLEKSMQESNALRLLKDTVVKTQKTEIKENWAVLGGRETQSLSSKAVAYPQFQSLGSFKLFKLQCCQRQSNFSWCSEALLFLPVNQARWAVTPHLPACSAARFPYLYLACKSSDWNQSWHMASARFCLIVPSPIVPLPN